MIFFFNCIFEQDNFLCAQVPVQIFPVEGISDRKTAVANKQKLSITEQMKMKSLLQRIGLQRKKHYQIFHQEIFP